VAEQVKPESVTDQFISGLPKYQTQRLVVALPSGDGVVSIETVVSLNAR